MPRGIPSPPPPFPGGRTPPIPTNPAPIPGTGGTHGGPFGRVPDTHDRGCADTHPDPELRELAASGGGGYFELRGTDDLDATFARVADELHHQYLLAFTPEALDGAVHTVDVRSRRPGVTVRSRTSYIASKER
jgi:hypothetical protein